MFYQYQEDQIEKIELAKNTAHLIGFFSNPELAKEVADKEKKQITTDDETFDNTLKLIRENKINLDQPKGRKRRKRRLKE